MGINWIPETRKLSELIPWEQNPRQLTKKQAKKLNESIDKFGLAIPYLVSPSGKIYDGHQRKNVRNGKDIEVNVMVSERELTDDERRELVIRLHGKEGIGEWDIDQIANLYELDELDEWGFDAELVEFLAPEPEKQDPGPEIDKAEELREKWGVETGQLWQLGEHRIICGDCTDAAIVGRFMGGEKAGGVVTDPPYGINREGIINDDPEGLRELYEKCWATMPIDNAIVIAFQSTRLFTVWLDTSRDLGHKFLRMLWLDKINDETFPWRGWLLKSEAILILEVGQGTWIDVHPYTHDSYRFTGAGQELPKEWGKAHATVKPLEVTADLVSRIGGDIYDPFLGSGTTLIACENLKRKCRGIEIEPKYIAVTLERWHQMTGQEPELVDG